MSKTGKLVLRKTKRHIKGAGRTINYESKLKSDNRN